MALAKQIVSRGANDAELPADQRRGAHLAEESLKRDAVGLR